MNTSDFDYELPPERIAQEPPAHRDGARMMVLDRARQTITHSQFSELPSFLDAGDLVVVNDTRVIPARIFGRKAKAGTGGKVELLLLEDLGHGEWDVLMRTRRRPLPGEQILLGDGSVTATLLADGALGRARVRMDSPRPFLEELDRIGLTPLPPYIQRKAAQGGMHPEDKTRYQTIYAREPGAVAAPTAGLHFTPEVFAQLAARGIEKATVTLHVGIGTFRPVKVEQVEQHKMDEERWWIPEDTAQRIQHTRAAGHRLVVVGTTTARTLESAAARPEGFGPGHGRTDIFIYPPYQFRMVDAMITNFHLPKSTLIMMISALAGRDFVLRAYREAIDHGYHFYSYGDCMLIL